MIAASLFANVLALASPIFVIQVLNRYVAHGVDATLATLTAGVAIAIALELAFRHLRMRIAASVNASYDRAVAQGAFGTLITAKSAAIEQLPPGIRQEMVAGAEKLQAAYNATNICTVLDVPFALLFIGVLYLLNPSIAIVVSCFVAFGFLVSVITLATLRKPSREMQMTGGGANQSLGIRRRLALARAMATDGMLVIVDEPTEGLDNEGSQSVFDAMNHLAGRGRTVLAFSHDPQILRAAPITWTSTPSRCPT